MAKSCSSTEETPGGAAAETGRGGPAEHRLGPLRPGHGGELHHTVTQNPQNPNLHTRTGRNPEELIEELAEPELQPTV